MDIKNKPPDSCNGDVCQNKTDSADVEILITNSSGNDERLNMDMAISPADGGASIYHSAKPKPVLLKAGESQTISLKTGLIQPETWSPSTLNLYDL